MRVLLDRVTKQLTKLGVRSVFLLPTLSLGLLAGILVLVIMPKFPEVMQLYYSLQEEQAKAAILDTKVSKLESIDRDSVRKDLSELTRLLPDNPDYSGLVYSVTRFARANALTVDDIKIDLLAKEPEHVTFQIDVHGQLESINTFLTSMNAVKRIYVPQAYEVRRTDNTQGEYLASFTVRAPFKELPKVLGDATVQVRETTDADRAALSKIRTFSSYTFVENGEGSTLSTKQNPFEN